MTLLAVKILLAPSFVVATSLVGRRFGPRVAGLVGGLPVVAGPLLLVFAFAHGRVFASDAAAAMPPRWDLPLRAASALVLVLALTAAAGALGPRLSGLLGTFPIITSVLATFTHAQRGAEDAHRLLRGFVLGFLGYALFCFVV